jgi:hypothetical protein
MLVRLTAEMPVSSKVKAHRLPTNREGPPCKMAGNRAGVMSVEDGSFRGYANSMNRPQGTQSQNSKQSILLCEL